MGLAAFLLLGLVAEIIGTVGGFGSSVYFVPLAQFFFDFKVVLGITAVFHVFSNVAKLVLFRRHIDHRLALVIGIPSVVLVILGAYITSIIELTYARLALGIFLVTFSAILLAWPSINVKPSNRNAAVGGGIAGFLAGLLGTGGAVRGITMAAFNLPKDVFVGTSAAVDFAVDASRSVVYLRNGYLTVEHLIYVPGLVAVAFLGSYIGRLMLRRLKQEHFRRLVLVLVLMIGLVTLGRSLYELT